MARRQGFRFVAYLDNEAIDWAEIEAEEKHTKDDA
jgi:hypothetical protein